MKDPFKMLRKVEEKEVEGKPSFDVINLEAKAKKHYFYVESDVFQPLFKYPEYEYLKNGLYVGKGMVKATEEVIEATKDIFDLKEFNDNFTLTGIDWYDAKKIAKRCDAKLLSPAELHCIIFHKFQASNLEELIEISDYYGFSHQPEWLDGCVADGNISISNPIVNDDRIIGGISDMHTEYKNLHGFQWNEYDESNIDFRTGFPISNNMNTDMRFKAPRPCANTAALFYTDRIIPHLDLDCSRYQTSYAGFMEISFRLCKKVEEEDLL